MLAVMKANPNVEGEVIKAVKRKRLEEELRKLED
jgi:hypothetical protein